MTRSFILLCLCYLLFPGSGVAQSWVLDPGFGDGGRLVLDVDESIDEVSAMCVQDDGHTLISGWATPFSVDFAGAFVVRLGPDGALDEDFGNSGVASTFLADRSVLANAMAEQADHAVVLAGGTLNPLFERDAVVLRYLADGTPDPSFGVDGMVTTDIAGNESFTALAIDADGFLICAGRVGGSVLVARYDQAGVLDPGFGAGGLVQVPLGQGVLSGTVGMGLRSDGGIAVACPTVTGLVLVRLDAAGVPAPAFGVNGVVSTGDQFSFHAFLLQPDDHMLVGGGAPLSPAEECQGFQLMRYDPDGVLDPTLDGDGIARTLISVSCPELFGLALLPDGRILATGTGATEAAFADLTAVRYMPDGSLDPTFNGDGKVFVDMGCTAMDVSYAIAEQIDGDVMVVGLSDCGVFPNDLAVMRIQPDINTGVAPEMIFVSGLAVLPNPVAHEAWLRYAVETDQLVSLLLWDVQGRLVHSVFVDQPHAPGTYREPLAVDALSAGLYTVMLTRGNGMERVRFVKE